MRDLKIPPWAAAVRWIRTNNPFYVISAGLFLVGLWSSLGTGSGDVETSMLMLGLAGYTLLLACTGIVLVRWLGVWDDARTVLLLVVLMFLATSVTFDDVLVNQNFSLGISFYFGGLAFAILLSEGILRSIGLRLPWGFRLPYYLILSVFFLYPLALSPLLNHPESELLNWGLFGFSTVAGLAFLTLLPAIRRGRSYLANNGSPWIWPIYPWALFAFLALAVPARAILLCWSMHLLNMAQGTWMIFGLYFLVPFGFALLILFLEMGLVSRSRLMRTAALFVPVGLIVVTLIDMRPDPIFRGFLGMFANRLGGDPTALTFHLTAIFYLYCAARRVRGAFDAFAATLIAFVVIGPRTTFAPPNSALFALAAVILLAQGLPRRDWRRSLAGLGCAVWAAVPQLPTTFDRELVAYHMIVAALLLVGSFARTGMPVAIRWFGIGLAVLRVAIVLGEDHAPLVYVHAPAIALALAAYGWLLSYRSTYWIAGGIMSAWFLVLSWGHYRTARNVLPGLGSLVASLLAFGCALLVSLTKSGHLRRWFIRIGWLSET